VGPRGHYSNPSSPGKKSKQTPRFRADLLDPTLWEAIEDVAQESATSGRRCRGWAGQLGRKQVQRRLSSAEIERLIAKYLAGATVVDLAEAYGIHRTTALALLERNQIARRGRVWGPELTEQAIGLYTEGRSCAAIARQFRVNPETVRRRLLAAGVELRRSGRPLPRRTS